MRTGMNILEVTGFQSAVEYEYVRVARIYFDVVGVVVGMFTFSCKQRKANRIGNNDLI